MKIERVISCFDEKTGKIQQEHNIDHINFEVLKKIFHPLDDDPLMYNPYTINDEEARQLKDILDVEFDLKRFLYQVDCFQA